MLIRLPRAEAVVICWALMCVSCSTGQVVSPGTDTTDQAEPMDQLGERQDVADADIGGGNTAVAEVTQGLWDLGWPDTTSDPEGDVEGESDVGGTEPLCLANDDGVIESTEIPASHSLGWPVAFQVNKVGTEVLVPNPQGTLNGEGTGWIWDFSKPQATDETVYESILPVTSFWFADRFPAEAFTQPFNSQQLGIYLQDETGFYLLGLGSHEEGETVLVYGTPVPLLSFPLKKGDSWSADEVAAEGLFEGEEYPADFGLAGKVSVHHTYSFVVDKEGRVVVPAGQFDVLRVAVDVTMEVRNSLMVVPVAQVRRKIVMFVAECAGVVARLRSAEGETAHEFELADEYKRLGL